jgi:hypothetical protein
MLDCFASYLATPYNDDNHNTLRHCERSETIHAGTLDCFASYLATPYNDDNHNTLRHCERSEAIQCTRMDCFTAFAMTESMSRLYESSFPIFALLKCSVITSQ